MRTGFASPKWMSAALALFLVGTIGCSNTPTEPGGKLSPAVESVSKTSAEIYSTVSSVQDIGNLVQGPQSMLDVGVPEVENPQQAMSFARSIIRETVSGAIGDPKFVDQARMVAGDTLIWDVTIRDTLRGFTVRNSLRYDPATGHGRLFHVRFNFDDRHRLTYDSTDVKVDLNFTLFEDADDVLLSLENLKRYKPDRLVQEEQVSFVPDPYEPGAEPDGGVLESTVIYASSSFISSTHSRLEYHEGTGGSWSKEVQYSDGKSSSEAVTFNQDGTGTFEETRRNGTHIVGTFDSADDDGQGSFTKTTTFPEGHDPVSVYEAGQFTINPTDSTLHGSFEKEVRFKDGSVRRESVTVDESITDGVKTTTITVEKPDGSGGTLRIVEGPDGDQIDGEWTNADGTFVIFSAESYPDGSAHFEFKLYASKEAYLNGEDPIASGEFNYFPDGSGQGTVAEGDQQQNVTIGSDGTVTGS